VVDPEFGGAGIAGGTVQGGDDGVAVKRARERVLATAGSKEEYSHVTRA
jgi:hypothetical protein